MGTAEAVLTSHDPQSLFWIKNKKIRYTASNPSFLYINVGFKGVYIARTCFPDVGKFEPKR